MKGSYFSITSSHSYLSNGKQVEDKSFIGIKSFDNRVDSLISDFLEECGVYLKSLSGVVGIYLIFNSSKSLKKYLKVHSVQGKDEIEFSLKSHLDRSRDLKKEGGCIHHTESCLRTLPAKSLFQTEACKPNENNLSRCLYLPAKIICYMLKVVSRFVGKAQAIGGCQNVRIVAGVVDFLENP